MLVLQMEVPFAQALEAAHQTNSAYGTVIWNLAPIPEEMTREMVIELLAVTDIVNEHKAIDAAIAIASLHRITKQRVRRSARPATSPASSPPARKARWLPQCADPVCAPPPRASRRWILPAPGTRLSARSLPW